MTMPRQALFTVLFASLLFSAARAVADEPSHSPVRVDAAFQWKFNVKTGCAQYHLGPWYSYFPYEAHFNMTAPYGGGGWLQQQPMYPGQNLPGQNQPGPNPQNPNQPAVLNIAQPPATVFGNYGPAPSYWYTNR